jgi:hypothetical protein
MGSAVCSEAEESPELASVTCLDVGALYLMQVVKLGIKPPSCFLLDFPGSWAFFLLIITLVEPYLAWLIMLSAVV